MNIKKYRKKPVVIEAEVYVDGLEDGFICTAYGLRDESICTFNCGNGKDYRDGCKKVLRAVPYIATLEGKMKISPGDYIITGIKGERYPCKPDIFEATYEAVDGEPQCTQKTGLTFGQAIDALKAGYRGARAGWNGKGMWLRIVVPGGDNKDFDMGMENLPYIEMKTADNKLVPFLRRTGR